MSLWDVAALVLIVNLPFGYWRANAGKFSRQWFLAVHLPVPIVIALRLLSGLGFQLYTFPVMIGAFFLGQYIGGLMHRVAAKYMKASSSCLVWDVVTSFRRG